MDPNKVEGLAEVLDDLARTRQVIVFSHDDRLAQAARRLPHPPTILTVGRGSQSQIVVRSLSLPAERYLDHAYALLKDTGLGDGIRRRVLPGVLRQAVETAAWERHSTERLRAGDRLSRPLVTRHRMAVESRRTRPRPLGPEHQPVADRHQHQIRERAV